MHRERDAGPRRAEGPPSAAQALTMGILDDIRSGRLPMSSAIHPGELARRHDSSRAVVRAALVALGHEGIVVSVPRKGYVLPAVEPREVFDLFVLRRAIEGAAAAEAAARLSGGAVAGLLATTETETGIADPLCLDGVHLALIRSCGSARLAALFESARRATARLEGAGLTDPRPQQAALEHQVIVRAVLRGDTEAAGRDMHTHIDRVRMRATRHWIGYEPPRPP